VNICTKFGFNQKRLITGIDDPKHIKEKPEEMMVKFEILGMKYYFKKNVNLRN